MAEHYASPRWSAEIPDCSVPMTLDTYSSCSYGCLYCFSAFQRGQAGNAHHYRGNVLAVDPVAVKRLFIDPSASQFGPYLAARRPFQWGGLSDQFDEFERQRGVTLGLLRFFRALSYPITFSTKATWWTADERYRELFKGAPWNVKFSIITLDEALAAKIERGVPTPRERLKAMERVAGVTAGGVTLRLRPYLIGLSNLTARALVKQAAEHGATAVSTEFLCLESRATYAKANLYPKLSGAVGFDLFDFYRRNSPGSGYLRLNREVKRPYVEELEAAARDAGLRFYVSDAHFKERCHNGSCCGLPESWNYSRGQFTEALLLAKRRGEVRWRDIASELEYAKGFTWWRATGYNTATTERAAQYYYHTMFDYLRHQWNHPNLGQSPYQMFGGVLRPLRVDDEGDVVYGYDPTQA